MLTPPEAAARLAAAATPNVAALQVAAATTLPDAPRAVAFGLLGRDAAGQPFPDAAYRPRQDAANDALARLATLALDEREQVFAVFFPGMAPQVALAWDGLPAQPYLHLLRAPGQPEVTRRWHRGWFQRLLQVGGEYRQDVLWFAQHAAYLRFYSDDLALVFAATIDNDPVAGPAVFDILARSAQGTDAIGMLGGHIPPALLRAARPDGWAVVERLLLGAQREEGLRQVILRSLANAHPVALRRLLGVVVAHDLARFSSVTMLLNQWFGATWDSSQQPIIRRCLERLTALLGDAAAGAAAVRAGEGDDAFLALWATATTDAPAAIALATPLLADPDPARRYAAAHLLAATYLPAAAPGLLHALSDEDRRVRARAATALRSPSWELDTVPEAVAQIAAAYPRFPDTSTPLPPAIWGWPVPAIDRATAADLLVGCVTPRDALALVRHLRALSVAGRQQAASKLAQAGLEQPRVRAALIALLADRAPTVQDAVIHQLADQSFAADELPALEALLSRKTAQFRRGLLGILLQHDDAVALASADRLLASDDEMQRAAGLEVLGQLSAGHRERAACLARAAAFSQTRSPLTALERHLLAPLLAPAHDAPTLDDALGLVDPAAATPIGAPQRRAVTRASPAALAARASLLDLIASVQEVAYRKTIGDHDEDVIIATHGLPEPDRRLTPNDDLARLPLADRWREWAATRPADQRDADGLEIARCLLQNALPADDQPDRGRAAGWPNTPNTVCRWLLVRLEPPPGLADFALDVLEDRLATLPRRFVDAPIDAGQGWAAFFGGDPLANAALELARMARNWCVPDWAARHDARLWQLTRWSGTATQLNIAPSLAETLAAWDAGAANATDLLLQLLGPRRNTPLTPRSFGDLWTLTHAQPSPLFARYAALTPLVERAVQRILDVELQRGEMPTAASEPAAALRAVRGMPWCFALLRALGDEAFRRSADAFNSGGKVSALSRLLRVTLPGPDDTPAAFCAALAGQGFMPERLIDLAVFAPQWAAHVEAALGWPEFAAAVWWLYAHTRDQHWSVDRDIRDGWAAQVAERTPLSDADLAGGAVDVAWFGRVYSALGQERWEQLYAAAGYASSGTGHARARLFADAMLGRLDEDAIAARLLTKRHQDSACALGLLPLPEADRDEALLRRYQVLQEFLRTSKSFGAERRQNEARAVRLGMENLARAAGYPDPIRLQWDMELRAAADMQGGVVQRSVGDTTVTLRIDALGRPHLEAAKRGKLLKDIPPAVKRDPVVAALRERKTDLEHQVARLRLALEGMMIRAEPLAAADFARLLGHPSLAPLLRALVFVAPGGLGMLAASGLALEAPDGRPIALAPAAALRIAHPCDLLASGEWAAWQRHGFAREIIQPFKQVFRELYTLSAAETEDGLVSRRYAGQQLQTNQAMALLARRGWLASQYDGQATRTFHARGLTATLGSVYGGGTAADVEGLTLEGVVFTVAGAGGRRVPLADVPPIIFSEVMRDLDLVVSVAHRGGVDPESSASTVEQRAALVRETCALLQLKNVRVDGPRLFIHGALADYALHLGSGVVHCLPGGALCIIPVQAQHRGRLFLPFADDDPKTAEIIAKTVLLAQDQTMSDPLILQQIFARA